MKQLEDRKKAFEKKFGHDEELKFKISVRSVKLFGKWASEAAGESEDSGFSGNLVTVYMSDPRPEVIIELVRKRFVERNMEISVREIERNFAVCMEKSRNEYMVKQATYGTN